MVRNAVLLTVLVAAACLAAPRADELPVAQPVDAQRAGEPDPQWIAEIVAADPAFGAGQHASRRVFHRMAYETSILARHDDRREAKVREQMRACDRVAGEQVVRLAPERDEAVLAFWRSEAGRALANAESMALVREPGGDVLREFAGFASDPDRVGGEAYRRFFSQAIAGDHDCFVLASAARLLRPEHAVEIRAFYRSDAGRRWLDIRVQAMTAADRSYAAFLDALGERVVRGMICPPVGTTVPLHRL